MVEWDSLENCCPERGREFKSHPLRHLLNNKAVLPARGGSAFGGKTENFLEAWQSG